MRKSILRHFCLLHLTLLCNVAACERVNNIEREVENTNNSTRHETVKSTSDGYQSRATNTPVFTLLGGFDDTDTRQIIEIELITLLLEKTVPEFGPFKINLAPGMTQKRAIASLSIDKYPNFVRTLSYSDSLITENNLTFIPYPVLRGLLSYRTCFVSKESEKSFAKANTFSDVKAFTHGQGLGWADNLVLRHNGFKVFDVSIYSSLFRMVSQDRFNLFCRGIHEAFIEYKDYKEAYKFKYDKTKAFYYPMPHFLYLNKMNTAAKQRLVRGFELAIEDGSFYQLTERFAQPALEFIQMEKRQIFTLSNPFIKNLDTGYKKHNYVIGRIETQVANITK